jgi:hypothetical protein
MEDIFTSDWFYDEKNVGTHIKSPIELIVGIQRMLPMKIENEEALMILQRVLGQLLFYPPNVAGWPGGENWIDSSSLMMRMRLPLLISDDDELNVKPKEDDDQMMGRMDQTDDPKGKLANVMKKAGKPIKAEVDWSQFVNSFEKVPREALIEALNRTLLQAKPGVTPAIINQYSDNSGRESFIKTAALQIMSTPEYQLS